MATDGGGLGGRRSACFPYCAVAVLAFAFVSVATDQAAAESLLSALARAYYVNPDLNQSRANVRVRDEDAPKAKAGLRPKASITAQAGAQYAAIKIPFGGSSSQQAGAASGASGDFQDTYVGYPRGATLNLSQTLFDGFKTENSVRQAESGVFAARSTMRLTEQATLQNGATAYMNVLRDTAVVSLRKNNIAVLDEQLKQTRDRFQVGEVTRTDVAQAEASVSLARSEFYASQAQLKNSMANYRQIIGVEPKRLEPGRSLEPLLPKSLEAAIAIAIVEHPGVTAALHQVDAAALAVKVAEAALMPNLSVNTQVSNQYDSFLGLPGSKQFTASAIGQLNVPLYQGGSEYASIRQAKEQLGQARLNADVQRDSVRASVVSSYGLLETAKASIASGQAAVKAAETALAGVREEAKVGQRTTLDVLNAQQSLLNARVNLLTSQRDRVVASYAALGSIGRLSAQELDLAVALYDPSVHLDQVQEKWFGVDTPDGQ
ncbi:TolC family outer membrane protein [Methylocystis sp.]|uniref:TolC family outer membrane protein n=1 Tax=Methylocystis sp. TaxID=1911079 RepID=UPI0025FBA640|nr:TolC family outer membrane protein [Methylocystis sp.]